TPAACSVSATRRSLPERTGREGAGLFGQRCLVGVSALERRRRTMARSLCSLFALCFWAGCCFRQEPILDLNLTPPNSVFKNSAWNKPLVIKSQDEAARHFGKDALETIARKVDFRKQIVLVFACQGSGGDKLEYKILESFPEQILFSLRPGVTDDLRSH